MEPGLLGLETGGFAAEKKIFWERFLRRAKARRKFSYRQLCEEFEIVPQ